MSGGAVRLVLATSVLVLGIVLTVAGLDCWARASQAIADSARWQAASVADVIVSGIDADGIRDAVARTDLGRRGELAVWLPDGSVTGLGHASPDAVSARRGHREVTTVSSAGGRSLLVPVRVRSGRSAVIEAFTPAGTTADQVWPELVALLVVGAGAVALAAGVARILVRRPLAAVKALREAASMLEHGDVQRRLDVTGPSELTALAASLNTVSQRVSSLVVREREMIADLSHRMRTPLTALRLDVDSIGPGPVADRVRLAVATLDHDLADVIRSATSNRSQAPAECDSVQIVYDRMKFWSALAEHQGRPCRFACTIDEGRVGLPASDLAAVLDALVTNIFQHTGSSVPMVVTLVKHAGWVSLVIEDGGAGIANIETALRRGGGSRGSTGLGLAIARDAAAASGGSFKLDRGRLGGARILLRFSELGIEHSPAHPLACRILPRYH
jgi:signal transduction histidine kinase